MTKPDQIQRESGLKWQNLIRFRERANWSEKTWSYSERADWSDTTWSYSGLAGSGAASGVAIASYEMNAIFILMILGWWGLLYLTYVGVLEQRVCHFTVSPYISSEKDTTLCTWHSNFGLLFIFFYCSCQNASVMKDNNSIGRCWHHSMQCWTYCAQ